MFVNDINGRSLEVHNPALAKARVEALIDLINADELFPLVRAEEQMYWQFMLVKLIALENKNNH